MNNLLNGNKFHYKQIDFKSIGLTRDERNMFPFMLSTEVIVS